MAGASDGWSATTIGDVPTQPDGPGPADWKPLRHHFGIRAFGTNAWVATEAGQELIEEHDEVEDDGSPGHEELYAITRGRATFTIAGERLDAPAGALVFLRDPTLVRSAVAEEPGTTVLCIGGWAERAFEPSDWELRRVEQNQ
jgi:hypothetical protein